MAGVTTQGQIARLLQEGINTVAQFRYERYDRQYAAYLEMHDSDKAYEIDQNMAPYGVAKLKPEGKEIEQDNEQQLYPTVYVHTVYGLRTEITFEAIANNLYYDEIEKSGLLLEDSLQETEEIVSADVINRGYTTFTIGDGKPVFDTAHVLKNGTAANRFSAFVPLSEAALEDACIAVSLFKDNSGKRAKLKTQSLCVHPNNGFTAERLTKSEYQPDTNNNAINAIKSRGMLPSGYDVSHYFTDTKQWFITTSARDGGKFFQRMGHTFRSDNSNVNTMNYTHTGITWFSVGVTDWRKYYASGPSV